MRHWIPNKAEIEYILRDMANKLKAVNEVSEIEKWLDDGLDSLASHVANRANVEKGVTKL